jgi:hypothetical protein
VTTRLRPASLLRLLLAVAAVVATTVGIRPSPSPVSALDNTPWTLPTVPPNCTAAQVNAGTVAGCVLPSINTLPENGGWPAAPFPATVSGQPFPPVGWVWSGYTYNGSPALAQWEAGMVANSTPIGSIRAGNLRLQPVAMGLFDGFMREVQALGYNFRGGSGYTFRCTSSSLPSCQGLTKSKLSLHASGLAVDVNSDRNPVRTYTGINGASACATPMVTDMPRWVIQTAEKWGLYWGGYGWSSGCLSPSQVKGSAGRDPTHFEFRGTVAQAQAVLAANGVTPYCVPTVGVDGVAGETCLAPGQVLPAGTRLLVASGAPAGTTAVIANVTAVGTTGNGALTVEDCGPRPAGGRDTAISYAVTTRRVGNLTIAPLDSAGRFCIHVAGPTHVVVDIQGHLSPAGPLAFTPSGSQRIVDSRRESHCLVDGRCRTGSVATGAEVVLGASGAPAGTQATMMTLVMLGVPAPGYLTGDRCDVLVPGPQRTSNLNADPSLVVSNLAILNASVTQGVATSCVTPSIGGHVVVDTQGFFAPPSSGSLQVGTVAPVRLVDTRECRTDPRDGQERCGSMMRAGEIMALDVPAGSSAVVMNVAALGATAATGYLTVLPCAELQPGPQAVASTNYAAGTVTTNLVVGRVGSDSRVCVYASQDTHVVMDLQAVMSPTATGRFTTIEPARALDTRPPA